MPFTLSHIVFALPFQKIFKRLSITGLVIGSILPDIEYYLRMRMYGTWGNTLQGIILYEIPIGIIISFLFHTIVRNTIILHAPEFIFKRWNYLLNFNWYNHFKRHYIIVILSLFIGIFTHLFLDLFTHESGYILDFSLAFLSTEIMGHFIFDWNQIILSIVGLLLLGIVLLGKDDTHSSDNVMPPSKAKWVFWSSLTFLTLIIYLLRVLMGVPNEKVIIQHIVFINSAFFLSLLIISSIYNTFNPYQKKN